jgi:hypothetical protein
MPPTAQSGGSAKKRGREEGDDTSTGSSSQNFSPALQVDYLRSASSGQLLGRLIEGSSALEAKSSGQGPTPYFDEIAQKEYVNNPSADVQVLVTCILAEGLRLSPPNLPFSNKNRAKDVLTLCCQTLGRFATSGQKGKVSSQGQYLRHALESLSQSHGLVTLSRAAADDFESLFVTLTETLLFRVDATDDAMVSQLASIVSDTIAAQHAVSPGQFSLLLSAIGLAPKGAPSLHPTTSTKPIAVMVFRRHEELLQSLLADHAALSLTQTAESLRGIDVADGGAAEKRSALNEVTKLCDLLPVVTAITPNLGLKLIPEMARHLNEDSVDIRTAVVKSFCTAFQTRPSLRREYPPVFHAVLSKGADQRPPIRAFVVKLVTSLIAADPNSDATWEELSPSLATRFLDADEGIRRQAIEQTAELVTLAPMAFLKYFPDGGEFAKRALDKKPTVRRFAIQTLASLYVALRGKGSPLLRSFHWIPNSILDSLNVDGGTHGTSVAAVEEAIETMVAVTKKQTGGSTGAASAKAGKASPSSKGAAARSASRPTQRDKTILFDFEGTGVDESAEADGNVCSALTTLCSSLTSLNIEALLKLMEKKTQLRRTVYRLFTLREEVKTTDVKSEAGQQLISMIHRLLAFLTKVTHANEEWNILFKIKDLKAAKSLLALCSPDCTDYVAASHDCLKAMEGKLPGTPVEADRAFQFLQSNLLVRLSLPLSSGDFSDAVSVVNAKRAARGSNSSNVDSNAVCLSAVRALYAMTLAAPHLIRPHVVKVVDWIREDSGLSSQELPCSAFTAAFNAELKILSAVDIQDGEAESIPKAILDHKKTIISTIGRICLQNNSGSAAKTACTCLCRLFKGEREAFQQLLQEVRSRLADAAKQPPAALPAQVVSWMRTFQVMAREMPQEIIGLAEEVTDHISSILMTAARATNPNDEVLSTTKKVRQIGLLNYPSPLSGVVDAAAKALVAHVSTLPGDRRSAAASQCLKLLITAFKATRDVGSATVGATLRRFAINKQLLRMMLLIGDSTGSDAGLTLAATIYLTAEENQEAREAIQHKIHRHLLKNRGDVTFASLLFLTAIGEDSRQSYSHLKSIAHDVAERFRQKQSQTEVTLSDQSARQVYLEYCLPGIISTLAHHPFIASERDAHFVAFQRVFILLFDELFFHGTAAASFLQDLLRRLKAHDDALNPNLPTTREVADLAAKVMLSILSQKSVGLEQVKPWPGRVLIPLHLFVPSRNADKFPADQLYLDSKVLISPQPQFKLPSITPSRARADDGQAAEAPSASVSPARSAAEPDEEVWEASPATKKPRQEITPPPSAVKSSRGGSSKK